MSLRPEVGTSTMCGVKYAIRSIRKSLIWEYMAMSLCQSSGAVLSSLSRAAVHAAKNSVTVKGSSYGLPGKEDLKIDLEDGMTEVAVEYGLRSASTYCWVRGET
jgi:hypothetical protein